jgi:hypothetical protein
MSKKPDLLNAPGAKPHRQLMQDYEVFEVEVTETSTVTVKLHTEIPDRMVGLPMDHLSLFRDQVVVGTMTDRGLDMEGAVYNVERFSSHIKEALQNKPYGSYRKRTVKITAIGGGAEDNLNL